MTAAAALLALEDGTVFRGSAFGSEGESFGEAVFNTGMACSSSCDATRIRPRPQLQRATFWRASATRCASPTCLNSGIARSLSVMHFGKSEPYR